MKRKIKIGDLVRVKDGFKTSAFSFEKGEVLKVIDMDWLGIDLEDPGNPTRWVTDVGFYEVELVAAS